MFYGQFDHTIDSKGRLIMPAKFREELGEIFYITRGMDNCLFIYTEEQWKIMDEKIRSLKLNVKEARDFARLFYSRATDASLDKQGRILISQKLREYANLDKDVSIIGLSNRIEVWNTDAWENYSSDENLNYDTFAEVTGIDI